MKQKQLAAEQPPKLVAIYARVSGDRQKKEETIESQLDAIQTHAKMKGYNVVKEWIFRDEAEKGKDLNRPGLDALRDLVFEGGPDVILLLDPDRLARRKFYQDLLIEEFKKQGVSVEFLKLRPIVTAEDQLTLEVLGVIAEYERTKIADRCRRGRMYKAKIGQLTIISRPPYGFKHDKIKKTYEIDLEKAEVVKEIFFLYARKQYSLGKICTYLDSKGIPTPNNGKHWEHTTLRDILKNESYIGTAHFGKTEVCDGLPNRIVRAKGKNTKSKHARKERPKESWIAMPVPAFIAESDFETAQMLLEKNKKLSARNTKNPSLLQGLLVCEKCKRSFYKKCRGTIHKYSCHSMLQRNVPKCGTKSIDVQELDALIWNEVIKLLNDPKYIEEEIGRRMSENAQNLEKHLKQEKIEKELKQLLKAKSKLLDAYQDGNCLTLDELRSRIEVINTKTAKLEEQLEIVNALKLECAKDTDIKASLKQIEERLLTSSTELTIEEKQKVVRLLIEEVSIGDDSIKIMHCIPPQENDRKSPLYGVRSSGLPGLFEADYWLNNFVND